MVVDKLSEVPFWRGVSPRENYAPHKPRILTRVGERVRGIGELPDHAPFNDISPSSSKSKMAQQFYVGQRLSYSSALCTVRYIGSVEGTKGEWLGVEWDDVQRGKHSGEREGKKYFECQSVPLVEVFSPSCQA